jgi:hypothetical protein
VAPFGGSARSPVKRCGRRTKTGDVAEEPCQQRRPFQRSDVRTIGLVRGLAKTDRSLGPAIVGSSAKSRCWWTHRGLERDHNTP